MKKSVISLIIIPILLYSCKKDKILLTAQDFPITVGSWWEYQVLDQNNVVFDTLLVSIIGNTTVGGVSMQMWSNIGSRTHDTVDVAPSNNSIGFYNYGAEYLSINFPVIDNEPWTTPVAGISYTTDIQNITLPNTSYKGAVYLNQYQAPSVGSSVNESIWIVKNIGIVKHIIANEGGPPYANEQLIAYHIN